jgi:hypothetical protein
MALTYDGTNGITFNDGSQIGSASQMGIRNRIINGHMIIDQRNAGGSVTPTTNAYVIDRWKLINGGVSSKLTCQQVSTAPVGFTNSLKATSTSAYSISSSDRFHWMQAIEGLNTYDLAWGTSNAKTVTVSFWVNSSLTGPFGGAIQNNNADRSYPFLYTINSANTWEYKTVTISGCTDGTWTTDTTGGLWLYFGLGCGSAISGTAGVWGAADYRSATGATSVVGTNGATFYITGVQLEKGSVATPFDFRLYGKELLMCQRYFEQWNGGSQYALMATGQIGYGTQFNASLVPLVFKRTTSSVSVSNIAGGSLFSAYGTNASGSTFPWSGNISIDTGMTGNLGVDIYNILGNTTAGSAGTCVNIILRANQYIQFSAEL